MRGYNQKLIPRRSPNTSIVVAFSIELYQIIEVVCENNEPHQQITLNTWVIERWNDGLLGWKASDFEGINELIMPADSIWIPDTMLYNTLTMSDEDTRRLGNVKITTNSLSATVEMLYPSIHRFSCTLNLRFFPFDIQHCKLVFGSWTYDNTNIDYIVSLEDGEAIGTKNVIDNGEWLVIGTRASREEVKFNCCNNRYTLLEFHIFIERKPLYWVVNLVVPTSLITFISLIGFFSTSSMSEIRDEKITLGITTLLSMSILVFMVSDKMPSTSSFIPLIGELNRRTQTQALGYFYLSMILLISFAILMTQIVIHIQKCGAQGERAPRQLRRLADQLAVVLGVSMPPAMRRVLNNAKNEKVKRKLANLYNGSKSSSNSTLGLPNNLQPSCFSCFQPWQTDKCEDLRLLECPSELCDESSAHFFDSLSQQSTRRYSTGSK